MELESFLEDDIFEMVSLDEEQHKCKDVNDEHDVINDNLDPIPFHEITPEDGYQALAQYNAPLSFCFETRKQTKLKNKKRDMIKRRQKSRARSKKISVSKRKMTKAANATTNVDDCVAIRPLTMTCVFLQPNMFFPLLLGTQMPFAMESVLDPQNNCCAPHATYWRKVKNGGQHKPGPKPHDPKCPNKPIRRSRKCSKRLQF